MRRCYLTLLILLTSFPNELLGQSPAVREQPVITAEESSDVARISMAFREELRERNDVLSDTTNELFETRHENQQLKILLANLEESYAALQEEHSALLTESRISHIHYRDRFVTHRSAHYLFAADAYGSLRVTLRGADGEVMKIRGKHAIQETPPSPELHKVSFFPLPEDTSFSIEVSALNLDGSLGVTVTSDRYPGLSATTSQQPKGPTVNILTTKTKKSHDTITLAYELLHHDSFIEIECRQFIEGVDGYKQCPGKGSTDVDDVNRPTGDLFERRGELSATFNNLNPETEYSFRVTALAKNGMRTEAIKNAPTFKTTRRPVAFTFQGPLDLEARPNGLQLSWSSTIPVSKASLELRYGSKSIVIGNIPLKEPSMRLIGALPSVELTKVLATKLDEPPVLVASMTNDSGTTITREIRFTYSLPKDSEAAKEWGLTDDQANEILKVVDKVSKKDKFDWRDLTKAGLPLILSFL